MYVALLGPADFENAWEMALPRHVKVLDLAAAIEFSQVTQFPLAPVVVLVDGTSSDFEDRLAAIIHRLKRILVVVAASRTTSRLAEWCITDDVVLLPPPCSDSAYLPLARCLVDKTLKLFEAEWSRRLAHVTCEQLSDLVSYTASAATLQIDGCPAPLLAGEGAVLNHLLKHKGQWVKPYQMSNEVFGRSDEAGTKLVWQYISRLRAKLKETDLTIASCRRRGYSLRRLEASSERDDPRPSKSATATGSSSSSHPR